MSPIENLKVKIFADGADIADMIKMANSDLISGLTTNPTLMRKAGIKNYRDFAIEVLTNIKNKPISFEVFSDDLREMQREALEIASWAENVYVKIPIMNTRGEFTSEVIAYLSQNQVKVNVTAVFSHRQIGIALESLYGATSSYISIFGGRIADTGVDPEPLISQAVSLVRGSGKCCEVIWASPRELYNVFQADKVGCHIITATSDILGKIPLIGKDLDVYSLETVRMFHDDAAKSGFSL